MSNNTCSLFIEQQSFAVVTGKLIDSLNQSFRGEFTVGMESVFHTSTWLGKPVVCHFAAGNQSRYFYGMIVSVARRGAASHVTIESPLCRMKQHVHTRRFEQISTHALFKTLLNEVNVSLALSDKMHAYIEQHQCADWDLFQRMIAALNAVYYFVSDQDNTTLHIESADQGDDYRVYRSEHYWQCSEIDYEHVVHVKPVTANLKIVDLASMHIPYVSMRKLNHAVDQYKEPIASAAHGDQVGLNFPLLDHTTVLIAHKDTYPDQPIIIGALYDEIYRNPIVSQQPEQHVIQTKAGHSLSIDDHAFQRSIVMKTSQHEQEIRMTLNAHEREVNVQSANGDVQWEAGNQVMQNANRQMAWHADQHINLLGKSVYITANKTSVQCESGGDIDIVSTHNLNMEAKKEITIHVAKNVAVTSSTSYSLNCEGNAMISSHAGSMTIASEKKMSITSPRIQCQSDQSSLLLDKAGIFALRGTSIELNAEEIFVNQSSTTINK